MPAFVQAKSDGRRLAMLTAYDYPWARLMDEAGVDSVLVGDSLGMVVQGKPTTLPVTLDEIIYHGEIVCRAVEYALTIIDMPFMTYHVSSQQAVENAGRILKETGADAVKIEGGETQAATIEALVRAGIPTMGHVGMQPQAVKAYGGFRVQRDREQLVADARAVEQSGVFGMVLELIPRDDARAVTEAVSIPTIGIGAGPHCDGQVLVTQDMLGLYPGFQPKFVKRYADVHAVATQAISDYIEDVQGGLFPDENHSHE